MAILKIRNLLDTIYARLRPNVTRCGRSIEAEHGILAGTCVSDEELLRPEELQEFVDRRYGNKRPLGVVDDFIAERRQAAQE